MKPKERFYKTIFFEPTDHPFRWETLGMWPETLDRWYREGLNLSHKFPLPTDWGAIKHDEYLRVLVRHFRMDRLDYLRQAVVSGYTESPFCPPFERQVLKEDGVTRIVRGQDGIIQKEFIEYETSSMPQYLRFPVENRKDFLELLPRLDPDHPDRLNDLWQIICQNYATRDFPAGLTICGAFGHPRNLMGIENLCTAYYEQSSLVHQILEQWVDFYCRLASRVYQDLPFDFVLIWEDMAYKGGSLISPRLVREFMLPYYRTLIDHVRKLGCEVIIVDSDGDVSELVPLFLTAGVNAMLPFEVQAGMDIRHFRQKYGKNLAIIGGIDKRLLVNMGDPLKVEIEQKVLPLIKEGGYIPCLDHTVPPDVSLGNFSDYLALLREMVSTI